MRGRETADVRLAAVVVSCRRVQQEPLHRAANAIWKAHFLPVSDPRYCLAG